MHIDHKNSYSKDVIRRIQDHNTGYIYRYTLCVGYNDVIRIYTRKN